MIVVISLRRGDSDGESNTPVYQLAALAGEDRANVERIEW